jgi:hypothetical protein
MLHLPESILATYRPASTHEVHLWSFGAVRVVRTPNPSGWRDAQFSLDDERIFGPKLDYQCACGKYRGQEHGRMICDRCGVKVTTCKSRRGRFGHIDFGGQVRHPFGEPSVLLTAFPVLPAAFRESTGGAALNALYEDVVRILSPFQASAIEHGLEAIVQVVLPILVDCTAWQLDVAPMFARGVGLVRTCELDDGRCSRCGFPLAGLRVTECPGCGTKVEPK